MSVSTIPTTPVQIYDGSQGAVSVKNQGPATVYLDSQSSVNPDNGWPLSPGSVVRWDRNAPLWAVTRFNTCRLNVNPVGMISDEVVTSVQRLLYTYTNPVTATSFILDSFECAQYETLLVRGFSLTSSILEMLLTFTWYDDALNVIHIEPVYFRRFNAGIFSVNVPAKGSFCQVVITDASAAPNGFSLDSIQIYGSTRLLNLTAENASIVSVTANVTAEVSRGTVFLLSTGDGTISLPQWGSVLDVYCTSDLSAGTFTVVDLMHSELEYVSFAVPASTDTTYRGILVPPSRPIGILMQGFAATNIYASLIWRDYV